MSNHHRFKEHNKSWLFLPTEFFIKTGYPFLSPSEQELSFYALNCLAFFWMIDIEFKRTVFFSKTELEMKACR